MMKFFVSCIGVSVLIGCIALVSCPGVVGAAEMRDYTSFSSSLTLDGVGVGTLKSATGGDVSAEVVSESLGRGAVFVKKHVARPKYEPFIIQCGWSMNKDFYDWIDASWKANYKRRNGVLITDTQREFSNALITETTIPACDAAGKEPVFFTVVITPELTRYAPKNAMDNKSVLKERTKTWLSNNFRLEIDGLECNRVSKIDAFTVKQEIAQDDIGDQRDSTLEPGKITFPNLNITLSKRDSATWTAWHEDFIVKGNNGDIKEKEGALIFLASNGAEFGRVIFHHLGIRRLTPATEGDIARLNAELYCEQMEFKLTGSLKD